MTNFSSARYFFAKRFTPASVTDSYLLEALPDYLFCGRGATSA